MSSITPEKHAEISQYMLDMGRDIDFPTLFPWSFAILDAAFWNFFTEILPLPLLRFSRKAITFGSVVYEVIGEYENRKGKIASIQLRAITHDVSRLEIDSRLDVTQDASAQLLGAIRIMIGLCTMRLKDEQEEARKLHLRMNPQIREISIETLIQLIKEATPTSKRAGPPTDLDNDWARAQLAAGRDREEVYHEWLQRRKVQNMDDPVARRRWRETFRKAMSRNADGRT